MHLWLQSPLDVGLSAANSAGDGRGLTPVSADISGAFTSDADKDGRKIEHLRHMDRTAGR